MYGLRRNDVPFERGGPSGADKFVRGAPQRMAGELVQLNLLVPEYISDPFTIGDQYRAWLINEMADKKMPPELLAHFKKKNEDKEGSDESKKSDKEKRKDALSKARARLEKKREKKD